MAFFKIKDPDTGQWVNLPLLKGDKGDKGDTGAKGDKGDPGEVTQAELDAVASQLAENTDNAALWRAEDGNPATIYPVPKSRLYPRIELVATQEGEGDPSPENVRPIVPSLRAGDVLKAKRTGKNLIDWESILTQFSTHAEVTMSISGNTITLSGTPTAVYRQIQVSKILISPSMRGKSATLSANISGNQPALILRQFNKSNVKITEINRLGTGAAQITISPDTAYLQIVLCLNTTTTGTAFMASCGAVQLELGSVATPYEPYSGAEYDLLTAEQDSYGLPDAPVVVDAGTVTVQDAVKVFNGTEGIFVGGNANQYGVYKPVIPMLEGSLQPYKCSHYKTAGGVPVVANSILFGINNGSIYFCPGGSSAAADIPALKAYLAAQYAAGTPVVVQYKIETPVTIPITPPVIAALDRLKRTEVRQNVLTVTANDSTVGVQKQTVTYQKSPIRESDEIAAAIAALA